MRLYDPFRGHPVIQAVVRTSSKTRRTLGTPAALATAVDWRFTPRQGFVKILPE
jgi:hypothetical protein